MDAEQSPIVRHNTGDQKYFRGKLIRDIWIESLSGIVETEVLAALLKQIYHYLQDAATQVESRSGSIDLLPFNIIASDNGRWHAIDLEWDWMNVDNLTVGFVLFRTLLHFDYIHGDSVANCFRDDSIVSADDFIRYGFRHLGLDESFLGGSYDRIGDQFQSAVLTGHAVQSKAVIRGPPLVMTQCGTLPFTALVVAGAAGITAFPTIARSAVCIP